MFENETPAERRTRRQQEAVAHRRRSIDGMNPAHPTASVDSGTCRDRMVVLSKSGPPAKPSQAWLLIKGKG